MRILIIGNYLRDRQRSMQRYRSILADGLQLAGETVDVFLPRAFLGAFFNTTSGIGKWLGYIDKYIIACLELWLWLKRKPAYDIVHICDHSNAHYVYILNKQSHTVTCHDMLAIRSALGEFTENPVTWSGRQQQRLVLAGLKKAKQINCVSEATRRDVLRLAEKDESEVSIIPNALPPEIYLSPKGQNNMTPDEESHSGISYLLHVGSNAWYKNRLAVLAIFRELAGHYTDLRLYIVGPPFSAEELSRVKATSVANRIECFQDVSDARLAEIYTQAKMLLFPSIIEGFGWPILEAQARGTPVLTSSKAPMSELNAVQEFCIEGDPSKTSWHALAVETVNRLLSSNQSYSQLVMRYCERFSVATIIQAHRKNYESL